MYYGTIIQTYNPNIYFPIIQTIPFLLYLFQLLTNSFICIFTHSNAGGRCAT